MWRRQCGGGGGDLACTAIGARLHPDRLHSILLLPGRPAQAIGGRAGLQVGQHDARELRQLAVRLHNRSVRFTNNLLQSACRPQNSHSSAFEVHCWEPLWLRNTRFDQRLTNTASCRLSRAGGAVCGPGGHPRLRRRAAAPPRDRQRRALQPSHAAFAGQKQVGACMAWRLGSSGGREDAALIWLERCMQGTRDALPCQRMCTGKPVCLPGTRRPPWAVSSSGTTAYLLCHARLPTCCAECLHRGGGQRRLETGCWRICLSVNRIGTRAAATAMCLATDALTVQTTSNQGCSWRLARRG